ncbi:MAG: YdcH family protein [Pseudobdellovibrionaceae bacterium]
MEDEEALREKLAELRAEHQDLDDAIDRLAQMPVVDALQLQRLKKRKLHLKDMMQKIESNLLPDIIA